MGPRGTGDSAAVDCTDNLDFFFGVDHSPDDPAEVDAQLDAGRELADDCKAAPDSELLPYLSSSATVDDMDSIRAALGEEQISYLGFSYGTYLGALYADKYPERVRAMVLDGAVDPSLGFEELARDQGVGFDSALNAFLDDCERNGCGFGGDDPHRAFTRLMAQIEAESLPGEVDGEERMLGSRRSRHRRGRGALRRCPGVARSGARAQRRGARRRVAPACAVRRLHRPPNRR